MPEMKSTGVERALDRGTAQRGEYPVPTRQASSGWVIVGAIVLGAWAAYHFGPDLRRYIKMEMM